MQSSDLLVGVDTTSAFADKGVKKKRIKKKRKKIKIKKKKKKIGELNYVFYLVKV